MQPTIMVPGGGRWPPSLAAAFGLALGLNLLLLLLYAVAWAGMALTGGPWAAVVAALDPRLGGSLPDLWAGMQLALTSGLLGLLARRHRRPALWAAAATVLILLTAEMFMSHLFLSAWFQAHPLPAGGTREFDPLSAKLLASAVIGACALAPAAALCRACAPRSRAFGRVLLGFVMVIGALGTGLDLLDGMVGMLRPASVAAAAASLTEEVAELFAITVGCAAVLDHAWGLAGESAPTRPKRHAICLTLRLRAIEPFHSMT